MTKRQILAAISLFLSILCVPSLSAACHEDMAAGPIDESGSHNVDCALAAVPLPPINAGQTLEIANAQMAQDIAQARNSGLRVENYVIVAIEWCKQPSFEDGTNWQVLDDREAYAWFITYLGPANPPFDKKGIRQVHIIRVKDNRKVDFLVGTRT